jgi:AraC family transcriptional regulator, regulatory protein of adaptative response / methylated-DNA-[protein]-cysteine methyltransferase
MNASSKTARASAATQRDKRWAAVVARDRSADGSFYYSVRTTGVYCRPSCPARLARPENVRFHASCAEAESAGYRPCKRCRPREASLAELHVVTVTAACRHIEQAEVAPSLATLAARAGLSPYHFHRMFKSVTGVTPRAYALAHRIGRIRRELSQGASVTAAIYDAGYNSNGRFYAQSDQVLGMTPSRYRAGGMDTRIRFSIGSCSLGTVLVAASDRGVCAIQLGDDPEQLVQDLERRFPNAVIISGDREFGELVTKVVAFVEAPAIGLDLPLDVRGTAFQQRVWQALRQVPAGATASYADIAQRIGSPRSSRAVAQACAANPLAVAIPCHRVVRKDGALSGYRWGTSRKRALLEREGRN